MQIEGRNAVSEYIRQNGKVDTLYISKDSKEGSIKKIFALAKEQKILIKTVDKAKLDSMSETHNHQGVILVTNDYSYSNLSELISDSSFIVILDEIEDPRNMGAIIRSAECAGADGIIIPKRRSASINSVVEKTSAGAVSHIKIARVTNIVNAIEELKKSGFWLYGLDMSGETFYKTEFSGKVAIVVGNEGNGIGRLVKEKCDFMISIPMYGKIQSLNASAAASVVLFEIAKQKFEK